VDWNDGTMGLRRIWPVSHSRLDHSRDSLHSWYGVALRIRTRLATHKNLFDIMSALTPKMYALPPKADIRQRS
jgi:hypothetical protein